MERRVTVLPKLWILTHEANLFLFSRMVLSGLKEGHVEGFVQEMLPRDR